MEQPGKIKFIGPQRQKLLSRLGIYSSEDLLYFFPRDYEDRTVLKKISDIMPGEVVCVEATVSNELKTARIRGSLSITKGEIFDSSGSMGITFFNQNYIKTMLKQGQTYIFYGRVDGNLVRKEMVNPDVEKPEEKKADGRILPIYRLTHGLTQKLLRKAVSYALDENLKDIKDAIPSYIIKEHSLCPLDFAIKNIHFPQSLEKQAEAKRRLIFDELFYLTAGMQFLKDSKKNQTSCVFENISILDKFYSSLEFTLTDAQKRVIEECVNDTKSGYSMNRLLQGDVGSGKTAVAAALVLLCVKNSFQAAFMAPTEILANQDFEVISKMLSPFGVKAALLTGSLSAAKRKQILSEIESGGIDVVVGTHALVSRDVIFYNLGLCVVDEQHRFGVRQRANLSLKGQNPHTLVMSATPIPRTLALIIYGDLDISIIDMMPKNRKTIDTFVVDESMNERIYNFVRKQSDMGHQTYFVCPSIEGEKDEGLSSVLKFSKELESKHLNGLKIGVMHGKMGAEQKADIMERFSKGEIQVLVCTTVIEVGINVTNATLMIIKDAHRFGLSQLHQLRGRVGRGKDKSYCILYCDAGGQVAKERLKVLANTNDGFLIANADLEFRGPGEFLGNRQHGLPVLKIADLASDMEVLNMAKQAAQSLIQDDPELKTPDNFLLKQKINNMFYAINNKNIFN